VRLGVRIWLLGGVHRYELAIGKRRPLALTGTQNMHLNIGCELSSEAAKPRYGISEQCGLQTSEAMAPLLLHEGAWRLEVENVVVCAVSGQPEIPHPLFSLPQRQVGPPPRAFCIRSMRLGGRSTLPPDPLRSTSYSPGGQYLDSIRKPPS
jgi:hypothetical protein